MQTARISRSPARTPRGPLDRRETEPETAAHRQEPPPYPGPQRPICQPHSLRVLHDAIAREIEPSAHDRSEPRGRPPGGGIGDHERKDSLRELGRAVLADLDQPVINHGIGEAPADLPPIIGDRQFGQSRRHFVCDHGVDETGQLRVGDRLAHQSMTPREPQIGQRRMAGVQHMQLEPFMGLDVADNLGARLLPGWTRPFEPVLDHPLCERLAADAGLVDQPQRERNPIPARLRRRGDDAIDHGFGKGSVRPIQRASPPSS